MRNASVCEWCRIRVEREDVDTLVLYVDEVRRGDEGQYSCEMDVDGRLDTQQVQVQIHGQLMSISLAVCIGRPRRPLLPYGYTAIKRPVQDGVKPSFVIFDIRAL